MPGEFHEAHFGYYPMHQLTVAPRVCHLGICGQGRCAEGPIQDISTRGDALGVPVGKVSVPKTGQKPHSPRRDASGVPVGLLSVPMGMPSTQSGPQCP